MKKFTLLAIVLAGIASNLIAQPGDVTSLSLSGNAEAANRLSTVPINYFTGIPSISVPLYNYSHHNGLNLDVSLSYFAGGTKVSEQSSTVGLNWYLNAGGVITRQVRGMPDDINANGFMYSSALPADYRANGTKYYYDTLDAEQDVYQFNFNGRSGKFYIGKNKQIVIVPLSKLKIKYTTTAGTNTPINSFTITTEDGSKYIFSELETQNRTNYGGGGFNGITYTTAWYLSQLRSPMGTDTIKFTYNSVVDTLDADINGIISNRVGYVNGGVLIKESAVASDYICTNKKIASIIFPDKKNISFIYDKINRYDGKDSCLQRIEIGDSVLRYGYVFNMGTGELYKPRLSGIDYFTTKAIKAYYKFGYTLPLFPNSDNNFNNRRDHWGYYNDVDNSNKKYPTVSGIYTGANRTATTASVAGSLSSIVNANGGVTYYSFEPNDIVLYSTSSQNVSINGLSASTTTNVSFAQVVGNQNSITLALDNSISRAGSNPFSGSCALNCKVTSVDGLTTYSTFSTNLNQLFYTGSLVWSFTIGNGNYKLSTTLTGCSSALSTAPVNFSWQNQTGAGRSAFSAGIRIRRIVHFDNSMGKEQYDTLASYTYETVDNKSSGFLSTFPKYDYPYTETVVNGSTTTTNYTAISSDPSNILNSMQGSAVGYSRVVVTRGNPSHNSGKEVYEFTDLYDANSNAIPPVFPFAPITQRDWVIGLPKRVAVYDASGTLLKTTTNTYSNAFNTYTTADFQSLRLGRISCTYFGNPNTYGTPKTETFLGQYYYPESGRSDLTTTIDSLYHPDGSLQVSKKTIQYDTNYNPIKVISPYNNTRGLTLEQQVYYPYHYTIGGAIGKLRDSSIFTPVSTENWITGDANPRMISASITDYQQLQTGEIKPLTQYNLQSNAPVAQGVIGNFNPASLVRNATYLKAKQSFTVYDSDGNLVETKNAVSNQSNSVIMDYNNELPIAQITNAKYSDVAYTSFESDGSGNWTISSSARDYTTNVTGKACYNLSNGSIIKSGLNGATSYIVSVWCKSGAVVGFNGQGIQLYSQRSDGWGLYLMTLSGITSVTIAGSGLIDELRLYPKDANMVTSTYEPMIGVTSSADANNTLTYKLYDEFNRTKLLLDKDKNILKKYNYSDSITYTSTAPNWQTTHSECLSGIGQLQEKQTDINPISDSYKDTRTIVITDCATCPPACPINNPAYKLMNCTCESGTRYNISTVQNKINGVWKWVCTFKYCFSDGSSSSNLTENNDTPCSISTSPCNQN